ncbi:MAG: hypothetical protein VX899_04460 [Myxococcota bacterium]|nr:hypothetical protein [Myxococcota bacterium]
MIFFLSFLACGSDDYGDCEHYIACSEATGQPVTALIATYGPDGSCWQGGADLAEQCRAECSDGITILLEGDGKGLPECEAAEEPAGDNPIVPEELWESWQYEVESACDEGETIYFIYGEGYDDGSGGFTATEWWYGFGSDPFDYDNDTVDTLEFTLVAPMTAAEISGWGVSEAERGYETLRNATDNQSGVPYGDDTEIGYIFDTLNPNGGLNYENRMLVYRVSEGRNGRSASEWGEVGKSFYYPDDESALDGAGRFVWQARRCY